jgi:hypothetical protein
MEIQLSLSFIFGMVAAPVKSDFFIVDIEM